MTAPATAPRRGDRLSPRFERGDQPATTTATLKRGDNLTPRSAPVALTPADLEVLEFAGLRFRYPGARESAILERFLCSETRYTQRLRAVLAHPGAEAYDAALVRRLRRIHAQAGAWRRS